MDREQNKKRSATAVSAQAQMSVEVSTSDQHSDAAPDPTMRVDLKALAKHLGLSKGTISRALNGYPEIAEKTRTRVFAAAAELGYKPNRAAQRLATGRNDLVSYIGVGADWMTVDRGFLRALSSTLSNSGFGLMVTLADSMDHAEAAMQQLIDDQRVDGFIFNGAFPMDARIQLAKKRALPGVMVGAISTDGSAVRTGMGDIPTIGLSDSAVIDGLTDYLTSLGHSAFSYFGCDAPEIMQRRHSVTLAASCKNRRATFSSSIRPIESHQSLDHMSQYEPESANSLTKRAEALLSRGPTAVFCGCERTVAALYMVAKDKGMNVPAELSIIGIGSSHLASWLSGGLSTVSWSLGEAGRLAADCIVAQIEGSSIPAVAQGVEAEFLARASHGPAPVARA
ncbi:MAG: LacI family DNA-binding transcriptional regulator [Pseudomonadota bacterium]